MVKIQKTSGREIEELFKVCRGISTDETSRTMLQTMVRLCSRIHCKIHTFLIICIGVLLFVITRTYLTLLKQEVERIFLIQ